MPRVTMICKSCGKEYTACRTPNWGVWRWQDIACCKEHAMAYIALVEESRSKAREAAQAKAEAAESPEAQSVPASETVEEKPAKTARRTSRKKTEPKETNEATEEAAE